jgi:hypothetical protein
MKLLAIYTAARRRARQAVRNTKWRIAHLRNTRTQCWADLVMWVLNDEPVRDIGLLSAFPHRPITDMCRKDAAACGRCYCGKLAADGTVLRRGESVPATAELGS